jgi:DNA polymerase III alpha subunit (gram-positive type)
MSETLTATDTTLAPASAQQDGPTNESAQKQAATNTPMPPASLTQKPEPEIQLEEPKRGATPKLDEYQQRVQSLLDAHEAKEEGKEPPPLPTLREGESWDSIYKAASPEVQRAMTSLRSDYTRKTQSLAEQRKEMQSEQAKLQQLQQSLTQSEAYKAIQAAAQEDPGEFDPYDPESFQKYVNKVVNERMQQMLAPLHQEQMKAQARVKLQGFMGEHPELKSDQGLRKEVKDLLLANETMSLENAFWIVQGKKTAEVHKHSALREASRRKAAQAAGLKIGSGRKAGITAPATASQMSGTEIYAYLAAQQK